MYHINDGLVGSFTLVMVTNTKYIPKRLVDNNEKCHISSIWGPTCSSVDCVLRNCSLPEVGTLYKSSFDNPSVNLPKLARLIIKTVTLTVNRWKWVNGFTMKVRQFKPFIFQFSTFQKL